MLWKRIPECNLDDSNPIHHAVSCLQARATGEGDILFQVTAEALYEIDRRLTACAGNKKGTKDGRSQTHGGVVA